MLLQILFDTFRLALEEWHMHVGDFEEVLDNMQRLLELLREFLVFLITPGVREARHLGVQARQSFAQVAIELFEMMGEAPKFEGVHIRLSHDAPCTLGFACKQYILIFIESSLSRKDKSAIE